MANHHAFDSWDDADLASDRDLFARGLNPDERIGPAPPSRARRALSNVIWFLVLSFLGWLALATQSAWRPWLAELQMAAPPIAGPAPSEVVTPPPSTPEAPKQAEIAPPLTPATDIASVPGTASNPPGTEPTATLAATPPEPAQPQSETDDGITTSSIEPETPARLPDPEPEPNDRDQIRALSVGLHPRVSKVLLSNLTDADFRNAGTAIRKALAETSDSEKFIWPQKQTGQHARFQIHFVQGAAGDCRRYVVTVVKNGWTTTAPPMEKCGISKPERAKSSASLKSGEQPSKPPAP